MIKRNAPTADNKMRSKSVLQVLRAIAATNYFLYPWLIFRQNAFWERASEIPFQEKSFIVKAALVTVRYRTYPCDTMYVRAQTCGSCQHTFRVCLSS